MLLNQNGSASNGWAAPSTLSAAWIPVRRAQSQWGKAISP